MSERNVWVLTWIVSKKNLKHSCSTHGRIKMHNLTSPFPSKMFAGSSTGSIFIFGLIRSLVPMPTLVSMVPAVEILGLLKKVKRFFLSINVFPTSERVTVWRSPKEAYHLACPE